MRMSDEQVAAIGRSMLAQDGEAGLAKEATDPGYYRGWADCCADALAVEGFFVLSAEDAVRLGELVTLCWKQVEPGINQAWDQLAAVGVVPSRQELQEQREADARERAGDAL